MESKSKPLIIIAALSAIILLFIGYWTAGLWLAVPWFTVCVAAWWLIARPDSRWMPLILMIIYVVEAAGGIIAGANAALFIPGAGLLLGCLEFSVKMDRPKNESKEAGRTSVQFSRTELLIYSVGTGVLLAEIGLQIQVSIPFIVLLISALAVVFCFFRFYSLFF